jgi:hypothetical protein
VKRILASLLLLSALAIGLAVLVGGASADDKGGEPKPTPTEGVKPTDTPKPPKPTDTPEEPKPTKTPEDPKPTKTPKPPHDDKDDLDGDGCTTEEESGSNEKLGGNRDPKNGWDLYDVNGDALVNVSDDVLGVAAAFGTSAGKDYSAEKDRSPPPSAIEEPDPSKREPWDMGPPDGAITVGIDIIGAAKQFGHDCSK